MKLPVKFEERRFSTAGLPLPVLGKTTLREESRPLEPVSFTLTMDWTKDAARPYELRVVMKSDSFSALSRRRFLGSTAAAAGPLILPSGLWSASKSGSGPNGRITVGLIGTGKRMRRLRASLAGFDDVQMVAVSDVVRDRIEAGAAGVKKDYQKRDRSGQAETHPDFRDLIERDDLDAVVVSTPDHWHAIQSILAARAGKHVYGEKPLTRTIGEGRAVVDAAHGSGIVYQTGSQQRTEYGGKFRTAVEVIRNGRLGELKEIHIGVGGPAVPCDLQEKPVPPGIDWEMWLGPAPMRGFNEVLCPVGVHDHFPRWRDYREYAGGPLSDIGAHHFDIAQWALGMDDSGPVSVTPPGEEGATSGLRFRYANGVEMIHGTYRGKNGCHFVGTDGYLFVDRRTLESEPASILEEPLGDDAWRLDPIGDNHQRNWIDCIRSGETPVADVAIGHRTNTVCLLANIGYWLGRPLAWNPERERFENDDEANDLILQEDREPWAGVVS